MGEKKLNITLSEDMADVIKARVESGVYGSADEVMQAAIGALLREEEDRDDRLDTIRERIRKSLDDPRPNLSSAEARKHLDAVYARHKA